jgi:hypothetical protein
VFLYRQILRKLEGIERAKKLARRPVVFARDEEGAILSRWTGPMRDGEPLVRLGLRLMEYAGCVSGDIDSDRDPLQRVPLRLQAPL